MLGITGADAAVIVTALATVIVALVGKKHGDTAKKEVPPPDPVTSGIAAVFADKELMTRNTMAMESIAGTLKEYLKIQTDKHEAAVEELLRKIDRKIPD